MQDHISSTSGDALTLPNFIERKHPRKGEKKKTRRKDQSRSKQASKQPFKTLNYKISKEEGFQQCWGVLPAFQSRKERSVISNTREILGLMDYNQEVYEVLGFSDSW
jgi:hypothetical protein